MSREKSVFLKNLNLNYYPNRRKLTKVGESESISYVVERDDNPTVEGTAFSSSTMNNLEDRIANITIDPASFSEDGLFTAEEKTKLNKLCS